MINNPQATQFCGRQETERVGKLVSQEYVKLKVSDESDFIAMLQEYGKIKEILRTSEDAFKEEMKQLLLNIVEITDSFDCVFANIESRGKDLDVQTQNWLNNFRFIRKMLAKKLKETGVAPIEIAQGSKAIPGLHMVVETKPAEDLEDDTILEEKTKGYLWHEIVLRKSEVIVVKNHF